MSITITLQPDETNGIDTYIDSQYPTTNYATAAVIWAGHKAYVRRSLIKFDLSSIPNNAVIVSATLALYLETNYSATNTRTLRVYRQLRDWVESQATWNIYSTGNSWATAGGFGSADCEQTDIGSLSIAYNESVGVKNISLTPTKIQEIILGSFTNRGFLLKMDTEADDSHSYTSSSGTTSADRPKLSIEYEVTSLLTPMWFM